MIRLIQRKLIIPRGDTGSFTIPAITAASNSDVAIFTIFDCVTHSKVFEKSVASSGEIITFEFTHNDTVNLPAGNYVWDIKFYKNPVYADNELVNGDEIDSYYAGYTLPACEIRETGDNFLMNSNSPAATLTPEQLDIISAAIVETQSNVEHYPYVGENNHWYLWDANTATFVDTGVRAIGLGVVAGGNQGQFLKKASTLDYDVEWGDETDPTVPAWAKAAEKPTYTAAEIGALPDSTFIPSKISDLSNDSGYALSEDIPIEPGLAPGAIKTKSFTAPEVNPHPNFAMNYGAIATGTGTMASGAFSYTEGASTEARGIYSHAEGEGTITNAAASHTSGTYNVIDSYDSWPVWAASTSYDIGDKVKVLYNDSVYVGYICKNANSDAFFIESNWTIDNHKNFAEIIGNGTDNNHRSNAYALDWEGNGHFKGDVYVNANANSTGGTKVAKITDIPTIPTNVSAFTNDAGYLTQHQDISGKANNADLSTVATTGSYNDLNNKPFIPTKVSDLTNDSKYYVKPSGGIPASDLAETYLTQHQDISGKLNASLKGTANGLAELDGNGKVPSYQLPSYVDDVLEYETLTGFPTYGDSGKIYIAKDTNLAYRWSGSVYVEINSSIALGETSSTAYRGDRGKIAYDHATAKGSAFTSGLYKITTNNEGHITAAVEVQKSDITGLGVPAQDTTYESKNAASGGTDVSLVTTGEKYNWNSKYDKPITGIPAADLASGVIPDISGKADKVNSAVEGNFAALDANGNLTDSGHKHSDYLTEHQSLTGKQDKVTASGILKGDGNGGISAAVAGTDYLISHQDISGKADKVTSATNGNFAALDSNGNLTDSGHKHSDYLTSHQTIPVTDVQVNGNSIISSGVANIPVASTSNLGVVKINSQSAINIDNNNELGISIAGSALIKTGTNAFYPLGVSYQHESAFYGFAKAAGDSTQSASSNTVGTYTDSAKTAIQSMLDVPSQSAIADKESTTATSAHSAGDLFLINGKLYKALSTITVGETITTTGVNPNAEETNIVSEIPSGTSGGSSTPAVDPTFTKIAEITTANEQLTVLCDTDLNGNSFSLKEIIVILEMEIANGGGNAAVVINKTSGNITNDDASLIIPTIFSTSAKQYGTVNCEIRGGRFFGNCTYTSSSQWYMNIPVASSKNARGAIECAAIQSIRIESMNGYKFGDGSKITVYGR